MPIKSQMKSASYDYRVVLGELEEVESSLAEISSQLDSKKEELDKQAGLRNFLVRLLYKQSRTPPLEIIFADEDFSESVKNLGYYQENFNQIQDKIAELSSQISEFEATKKSFEDLKVALDAQRAKLSSEVGRINYLTKYYNNQKNILGTDLNATMARQALLAWQEKEAGNGAQSLGGDGAFYFYGYGTQHGVGMSQWGGFQKATEGKTADQVLTDYYTGTNVSAYSATHSKQPGVYDDYAWQISVSGVGKITYAQYLAGIGETDPVWYNINANAARVMDEVQVIAARGYALSYTGGDPDITICTTQSCQVYVGGSGKADAVSTTRNKVVKYGEGLATTYYFSTSVPHTDSIGDSPSFSAPQSYYPYLVRVNYDDTTSPLNNWCGIMNNSWSSQSKPPSIAQCNGSTGAPLTNADLEFIVNAAMLRNQDCGATVCPESFCNNPSVGHLQCLKISTTPAQVDAWLNQEGTPPVKGLNGIRLIRIEGSSDRVARVEALKNESKINGISILGIRFRYVFNILSPAKDFL